MSGQFEQATKRLSKEKVFLCVLFPFKSQQMLSFTFRGEGTDVVPNFDWICPKEKEQKPDVILFFHCQSFKCSILSISRLPCTTLKP